MERWTATSAAALCAAMGCTLGEFAQHLGLSHSTVAKWNRTTNPRTPGREAQELLSVALAQATPTVRARFHQTMGAVPDSIGGVPSKPTDLLVDVDDAAAQAEQLANDVAALGSDVELIEHQYAELSRLAIAYVHQPLPALFSELHQAHNTLARALRTPHRPSQTQDLMFLTGVASLLLAHASQNLGNPGAALKHLRAAATLATAVDSAALRAWSYGSSALLHEWSRRPDAAVRDALKGLQYNAGPQTRVRLLSIAARSAARSRQPELARQLLVQLHEPPGRGFVTADAVEGFGGLLSFPDTKRTYYAGGAHALLGDYPEAQQLAAHAIVSYEQGPPEEHSYGDLALARIDHARACLGQDNLTGATTSLGQVLSLPEDRQIKQLDGALTTLRDHARQLGLQQHRAAGALADQLTDHLARQPRALPSARA
ncbi:hypothetical protein [Amycolatopsis sp. NPDC051128]|uniref:hypothetical protein n=1 Tax=Amycolatopsis sp. NPDC051128 TaxID=3155412 RepID=UPI0034168906